MQKKNSFFLSQILKKNNGEISELNGSEIACIDYR